MRVFSALLPAAALILLAGCDMGAPAAAGFPRAVQMQGNAVTLDYGGRSCTVAPPEGTGLGESFSIVTPAACPGVIEIGVARLTDPDAHVVQIVPASIGPLQARGQAGGIAAIEVIVMIPGGAIGGYVGPLVP